MADSTDSTGFAGQASLTQANTPRQVGDFHAKQRLAGTRTMVPVKVIAVHYPQGSGPNMAGATPTLDVAPLIHLQDGQGNATPHGTVYGIQAPRNRSGTMEIINDPIAGDMGYMHLGDRDMSSFLSANAASSPGSFRRHSLSDGVFVRGHNPGTAPKQYILSRSDGVTIADSNGNMMMSDGKGWHFKGAIFCDSNVTAGYGGSDSVTLQGHTHPTAPQGPASAPTAGT